MATIKMIDSAQLDSDLKKVANAIRAKGETSAGLSFPNGFVDAITAIPKDEPGAAVSGTFTPVNNLRSVTLSDCAGKNNIFIYPMFDFISAEAIVRIHWGVLIVDGRTILQGSSNVSKDDYVMTVTAFAASGHINDPDTYNSSTGTVTINIAIDGNYGGCFTAGKTYGYLAW